MEKNKSYGFSILELLIITCFIIIIGLVSLFVFRHHKNNVSSCSSSSQTCLVIDRSNPLNQPGVSNFSIVASSISTAKILNEIKNLTPSSSGYGVYHCPLDDGVIYTLKFKKPDLSVTAKPTGCQSVSYNNQGYSPTAIFWQDIKDATHKAIDPATFDCQSGGSQLYCSDN